MNSVYRQKSQEHMRTARDRSEWLASHNLKILNESENSTQSVLILSHM